MVYSIQVDSKLYSLYQIVVSYKLQVYIMLIKFIANCCHLQVTSLHYVNIVYSKFQSVSYYTLHSYVVFELFVQSEAFLPVQLQK